MNKKIFKILIAIIIFISIIALGINRNITEVTTNQNNIDTNTETITGKLEIYFIDVGQADSILVINNDKSMLIDAGNNGDGKDVIQFIKDRKIEKIDYLIGTHPHEDHIGGLDNVIEELAIEKIYMPKIQTNTKTFEDVLDAISQKGLKITEPIKGDIFQLGDAKCEIMTDSIIDKNNLNLSSIVIRLEFGNNSFLFMGDSEIENEKTIKWPKTDVLKVGHHGSNTSTSEEFLNQVLPKNAVIMVGEGNSYGLPKKEILERLEAKGIKIYRTDKNHTIQMISDGNDIEINTDFNKRLDSLQ